MANKKIIDLPAVATVADADLLYVGNPVSGALSKATKDVFLQELKAAILLKANSLSPALTGTPTTTTATAGDNSTRIATTAFIQAALADLVGSAPSQLNTLNELATALGNDANFASTISTVLSLKIPYSGGTFTGNISVPDDAYDATTWNGSAQVPTKNAIRDKIESLALSGGGSADYPTLTALKAVRPANGTLSSTAGYSAAGDGGHGVYFYDSASTATDNGGTILLPTTGSGAGRWKQIPNNGWVNAKTFGVKADGTTDDTAALQASENGCKEIGCNLELPRGKIKTTAEFKIGVASSDPNLNLTTFHIRGAGVGADSNAAVFPGAAGTAIRLYGTGHRSVVCFEESNWRYGSISNLSVECDTIGGATYGVLFADTRWSQFTLDLIHSNRTNKAFAILKGNGNNGEFVHFNDCAGSAEINFFYMDEGSGQSYNHVFYNCRGGVAAGGSLFDVGGSDPGYGFSCYNFNSTSIGDGTAVAAVFNTAANTTFLNLRGSNGIFEFSGGRNEHISRVVNTVNGSMEFTAQVHFKTVYFGGMISNTTRKTFSSTGSNNNTTIMMTDGCILEGIGGQTTTFGFDVAVQQSIKYHFENTDFNFTNYSTQMGREDRLAFINCRRLASGYNAIRFSTIADKKQLPLQSSGVYSNALVEPAFIAGVTTLPSSWVLGTGTIFAVKGPEHSDVAAVNKEPFFRELVISTGAVIYQDVSGLFGSTIYYKCRIGGRSDSADVVKISLENSVSGRVYDSFSYTPSIGFYDVLLIAHDPGASGALRVKITGVSGVPTIDLQYQLVSNDINASYYKQEIEPLPVDSKIVYFGDSLTDDGLSDSGATNQFTSYGFTTLAQILAGSPFLMPYGGNKGIGGQTTTTMVTRLGAAVALKPKIVTVLAGTNDLGDFATAATVIANLDKIYNAFLAAGAIVIALPIFPRADFGGGQEADRVTINNYIKSKVNVYNFFVADANPLLTSPGTVYRDGIHLNSVGGAIVGGVVANVLRLFAPNRNVADLVFTDQVVGLNTLLTGTGGTLDNATGSVADNWTLYGGAGAGGAAVAGSKDGNVQVITISGTYTGNDKNVAFGQYAFSTPFAVGDLIEGVADIEIVSHNAAISNVYFDIGLSGAGGGIASNRSIVRMDNLPMQLANGRYLMRTPASYLTEAATFIAMLFYVEFVNTGTTDAVSAVIRINRLAVRKVNGEKLAATAGTVDTTIVDGSLNAISGNAVFDALVLKAPLDSPTFTNTPTLPTGTIATTQAAGNNTTAIATTAFVQASKTRTLSTKTTAYTLTSTDDIILADTTSAAFTLTLPAVATSTGKVFIIKKISSDANAVTVDANASELIDGDLTQILGVQWVSITIVCNGTSWFII